MNISSIKTPGVYIDEKDAFPPSIANVATAIPAFVGFTEKASKKNDPIKITSLLEYEQIFGGAAEPKDVTVVLDANNQPTDECKVTESDYKLYNSLRLFYANGGGICYIVSVGLYGEAITKDVFIAGLKELEKKDEPTLFLFPDAVSLPSVEDLSEVQKAALTQCNDLMDRFTIMDVKQTSEVNKKDLDVSSEKFRTAVGNQFLKYGAAYYPYLQANFPYQFRFNYIDKQVDFSDKYKNDDKIVKLLKEFKELYSEVYNDGYELKWKNLDKNKVNVGFEDDDPTKHLNVNEYVDKIWNLLGLFKNLNSVSNTSYKNYLTDLVKVNLKGCAQQLIDFKAEFDTLLVQTVESKDIVALTPFGDVTRVLDNNEKSLVNNTSFDVNVWGNFSATDKYKDKLNIKLLDEDGNEIKDGADSLKIINIQLIQAELDKILVNVISTMDSVMSAISNYILEEERKLITQLPLFKLITDKLSQKLNTVPPSGAIAGIYAQTDATRGVWKAPANVSVNGILGLTDDINDRDQQEMNIHETGKSINAIRKFTGRGTLVWGARTLDGNSNDWRYVNVRRLANMIEEATKKACMQFVFEPNVAQTWMNVKGMIENYLTTLWNDGALAGAKPEHAFFVAVGLNQTMSAQDILEGRLIVKIGYAPSRPAEFIILEFKQMQQKS
ncbi:phage tail sheath subtilisin-like domain-containing protein [Chryseobacterium sp. PS-8]|uniref:Phage tail sheath subtilisin-like domain-containing protein n=1 Tax=Chryseobacterium indicum TaxID=2766954 RepID=A0ABS9C6V9_9FLAO|nr:phage tail sheath C-terminal domain-containing protein [Chryseobacterium sp. PS-8]MCF2219909.1 phage tail sheath subtilisin-like domain-containing protein [Chryseobacterium sp. PS-8]